MIVKFNDCHEKSIISKIISLSLQLFCMVGFLISQLLGPRILWLIICLASVSVVILFLLITKIFSINKKVYWVLDDNEIIVDNKYIKPTEIYSISITETFISFKIKKYKSFVINLKWVDEDDKTYLIYYFNKLGK